MNVKEGGSHEKKQMCGVMLTEWWRRDVEEDQKFDVWDQFLCIMSPLRRKMPFIVWLARYFGMSATRVEDVREEFVNVQTLHPDVILIPLYRSLSMEFSCSLSFAKTDDGETVYETLTRILLLRDRGRPMTLSLDRHAQKTRHYVYFDNVGVIDSTVDVVAQRKEENVESFEYQSFKVHEQELHSEDVQTLDVELDG